MSTTDPYAARQIATELAIVENFQQLLTPEATAAFLQGKTDWISYHPTLLEIIRELEAKMKIVYTIHVMEAARLLGLEGPGLETLAYNSSRYWDAQQTIVGFNDHLTHIRAEGFCLVSQEQAETILLKKTLVEVYLTQKQRIQARLTKTTVNGYCWMMPRYRTKGYSADFETQYVKLPVVGQKSAKNRIGRVQNC